MERCRKRVRHFHEPGQLHDFSFSCYYHRWPLLINKGSRQGGLGNFLDLLPFDNFTPSPRKQAPRKQAPSKCIWRSIPT